MLPCSRASATPKGMTATVARIFSTAASRAGHLDLERPLRALLLKKPAPRFVDFGGTHVKQRGDVANSPQALPARRDTHGRTQDPRATPQGRGRRSSSGAAASRSR
jgi:hypothetical protein